MKMRVVREIHYEIFYRLISFLDPIDPQFHSPSRRASYMSSSTKAAASQPSFLPAPPASSPSLSVWQPQHISPSVPPPARNVEPSEDNAKESEGDDTGSRRRTIAERMARLGGIKFGATPIPVHQPPATALHQAQTDGTSAAPAGKDDCADDTDGEEDGRERKERIAAKLTQ